VAVVVTDVAYDDATGRARAAGVVLASPSAPSPVATFVRDGVVDAAYRSGEFFARELPLLLPLLRGIAPLHAIDTVVVDAYVDLGVGPGMGRRLHEALAAEGLPAAVIGIAKNPHAGAPGIEVRRGTSDRPLWVTAADLPVAVAATEVAAMAGAHRLPDAVRLADHLARGLVAADVDLSD
jgi:deoxyribonuclease V